MRIVSALLFYALLSCSVQAQNKFGLKGGLNLSSLKIGKFTYKITPGLYVGGFTNISISQKFSADLELLYSQKGGKIRGTNNNSSETLSLNYITLPLLLSYHPTPVVALRGGVELGILAGARSKIGSASGSVKKYYNDFDAGICLDGSLKLTTRVGINARYVHGFKRTTDFFTTDELGNEIENLKSSNRTIQLGVFCFFGK